jgi:hypothetical protein
LISLLIKPLQRLADRLDGLVTALDRLDYIIAYVMVNACGQLAGFVG